MIRMYMILRNLVRDTRGQDLAEYALLLGFVATATGASFPNVAGSISTLFSRAQSLVVLAGG